MCLALMYGVPNHEDRLAFHYEQQKSENYCKSLTNPQLIGKSRKISNPSYQRSENIVKRRNPLKRHDFPLFPPFESVAIFDTPLFDFTTFHDVTSETSVISVPHC
jgi:hypothetical protein